MTGRGRGRPRKIDLDAAVTMRGEGQSWAAIARVFDVTPQAVQQLVAWHGDDGRAS